MGGECRTENWSSRIDGRRSKHRHCCPPAYGGQHRARRKRGEQARIAPRRRTLKSGKVAYNDRHVTIECTLRDMSATGARLRVSGSVTAPDTFELLIPLDGLEANCQVVWRSGADLGVRFLSAPRMVTAKRQQVVSALTPLKAPTLRRKPRPGEPG